MKKFKMKGMWSTTNLKNSIADMRKVDNMPHVWQAKTATGLEMLNTYHYSSPIFTYRAGTSITKGGRYILIDVDEEGSNVEEKLREYKLGFIKVPSRSATDDVTYKWHYFIKTDKRLSKKPDIARGQIADFYAALGLEGSDTTAIDPVRYFAPCGCKEIIGTEAHTERLKWCNDNSTIVEGNVWVVADEDEVTPIYGTTSAGARLSGVRRSDVPVIDADIEDDWEPALVTTYKANGKPSYKLTYHTPISIGEGKFAYAGALADMIEAGEVLSNVIGCPGRNHAHDKQPDTVGYGYITKKANKSGSTTTFFNCGGNSCNGITYSLFQKATKWQ